MINSEVYKERFSVPDSSGAPDMETIKRGAAVRKKTVRKNVIMAVCAFIAVFALSNGVSYAASGEMWIGKVWRTTCGSGVIQELRIDENGDVHSRGWGYGDGPDYTVYENGRTYFVFGKTKTDITDIVAGGEDYYKYEYTDGNGIRHVILVGEMKLTPLYEGGPDHYFSLWVEQLYYPNGHVGGTGVIPRDEDWPEWMRKANRDYHFQPD